LETKYKRALSELASV